jgi:hypothetical protein
LTCWLQVRNCHVKGIKKRPASYVYGVPGRPQGTRNPRFLCIGMLCCYRGFKKARFLCISGAAQFPGFLKCVVAMYRMCCLSPGIQKFRFLCIRGAVPFPGVQKRPLPMYRGCGAIPGDPKMPVSYVKGVPCGPRDSKNARFLCIGDAVPFPGLQKCTFPIYKERNAIHRVPKMPVSYV